METRRDGVVARTPGVISTDLVGANCGLSFDLGVHERNQLLRSEDVQRSLLRKFTRPHQAARKLPLADLAYRPEPVPSSPRFPVTWGAW